MAFDWFRRRHTEAASDPSPTPETQPDSPSPSSAEPEPIDYLAFAKAAYANLKAQETQTEAGDQTGPTGSPAESASASPDSTPESQPTSDPTVTDQPIAAATEPASSTEPQALASDPSGGSSAPEASTISMAQDPTLAQPDPQLQPNPAQATDRSPEAPEVVNPTAASIPASPPAEISRPAPPDHIIASDQTEAAVASAPESPEAEIPKPSRPQAFFDRAPRATQRLEALEANVMVEPEPVAVATAPSPSAVEDLASAPEATESEGSSLIFDAGFRWSAELLAAQGRKPEDISVEEITWLQKLQRSLGKTRLSLINQLKSLVGRGPIDADAVDEIETTLLQSDVGLEATDQIISALQRRMRKETLPPDEAVHYLKQQMREMLSIGDPTFAPVRDTLNIWLIVGVNGAGKTTTIGKIAHIAQKSGYRCLIAAADTFRAAAVEQLKIWGERAQVEVIANPGQNTDPAAVVFDAITAAQSRSSELLLVDTAGRLQNKKNLMDELSKVRRIIEKKAPEAQIESLLVLDSTLGQNGLRQAQVFAEVSKLSGVVLTKLDSTAKGGIAFAITQQLNLPIRFIGAGEGIEDLRPFSSYEFVEALLSEY